MHLKRAVFAPGLIVLGDSSLHHNEGLEEVILPDTVISIEKDALSHAYSLRHIDLPPRLETLGRSAFLLPQSRPTLPPHTGAIMHIESGR